MNGIKYPIIVHNGHLIVDFEGRKALVDTGSPVSFGRGEPLSISGRNFPLHEEFFGITAESIAEPVGYPLDLVVGMDVIGSFETSFSVRARELVLNGPATARGETLVAGTFFGVPTIPIMVNGVEYNVIFDTGAPTSYLSESIVSGYEFAERREDFFPTKGTFSVDVYRVPVAIGSMMSLFEFGAMKGILAEMLEPSGMPGILGTEVLNYVDVTLAMAGNAITLTELAA